MPEIVFNPGREQPSNIRLRSEASPYAQGLGLEIGPFDRPYFLKEEHQVEYLDYRTTEEARAFAAIAPGHDPQFVPDLDYVVPPNGDWSMVANDRFDWILSSHALEHAPSLIDMILTIADKLKVGGVMITMLPDSRRTFDVFRPVTTIGQIIEDHLRGVQWCRPQAVFDLEYYGRHVSIHDAQAIYYEKRDYFPEDGDFVKALEKAKSAVTGYVDTHNYVFTSKSFQHIISVLCNAKMIPFEFVNFSHTPGDDLTFLSVLRKIDV